LTLPPQKECHFTKRTHFAHSFSIADCCTDGYLKDGSGGRIAVPLKYRSQLRENAELAAGIGMALGNRLLLRAGLRRRVDGWRRAAGLVLRGEAATFVLSVFGLDVWSDAQKPLSLSMEASQSHIAARLAKFLAGEAACFLCVKRGELEDRTEVCSGPSYTLGFAPWVEGPSRFVRPDTWVGEDCSTQRTDSTDVLFNIICRVDPGGAADVWVRVNHIAIDGVPSQEIISRLEAAWGVSKDVAYPSPQAFAPYSGPRKCAGREGCIEMQTFIDFGPLLTWRKHENERLPETMTLSAAILWCLARCPAFSNIRFGTTVEVPATKGVGRGVGVIVVHPADYFHRKNGLARYVVDFNRQLKLTRQRASSGCQMLDAAGLISPTLATTLLRRALQGDRAFGSMGLTVIRDAKVFGAPLGDFGHPHGFMAIGGVGLPAGAGRKVGCVTIKGPAGISEYPGMIQEAIRSCGAVSV
jgi:hypothetical protein